MAFQTLTSPRDGNGDGGGVVGCVCVCEGGWGGWSLTIGRMVEAPSSVRPVSADNSTERRAVMVDSNLAMQMHMVMQMRSITNTI